MNSAKNKTTNYNKFEQTRLTFTELKDNDRSKGQRIAFPQYHHPEQGEGQWLLLQMPWMKLFTYGVPRLGDYYESDDQRCFVKLPFDLSDSKTKMLYDELCTFDKRMDSKETREVLFIAYGLHPYIKETWTQDMNLLSGWKFWTVLEHEWTQYPHDGYVFRVDSNQDFENFGYTAHHPKGIYALKRRQKGKITTLVDVIWNVGKSGVVAPVAILKPVEIDDAIISRATLHNMRFIDDLNLEIGCEVEVIRSGEIIPRIVRRVD